MNMLSCGMEQLATMSRMPHTQNDRKPEAVRAFLPRLVRVLAVMLGSLGLTMGPL